MLKRLQLTLYPKLLAAATGLLLFSDQLVAALPTAVAPSNAPKAGDWLTLIKGYAKDAGLVIGLVLAVVAFLWIAWISISKFNEARTGKAEWGEVGLTAVVAAGVMIFISYLLTEASNVI
ncbi:TIGR03745 family integrating conjugative element membrane protein [Methylicorpusculum oleiharenae]|uniref:TIGR03745 family integrating conjugative element membrane protein n=1 Tax=Methylicorpusculum oleiharenae TaxID=1338687 RepID=UPI00135B1632|nr:TIGR03745 family integrating conjugative element membrane protein [Methylicorpusculum oleiharenae]MCD2452839.1 TIGR03745 family integrating conjugative element membrane protein [Methylicorpusculum oleiharenae]